MTQDTYPTFFLAGMFSVILFLAGITLPVKSHADDILIPLEQKVNVHESAAALTGTVHVSPDGDCKLNDNCFSTIQAAINFASSGCTNIYTIRIGEGTYTGHPYFVYSYQEATLDGGWNFATGSHTPGTTKIWAPLVYGGKVTLRNLDVKPD